MHVLWDRALCAVQAVCESALVLGLLTGGREGRGAIGADEGARMQGAQLDSMMACTGHNWKEDDGYVVVVDANTEYEQDTTGAT